MNKGSLKGNTAWMDNKRFVQEAEKCENIKIFNNQTTISSCLLADTQRGAAYRQLVDNKDK